MGLEKIIVLTSFGKGQTVERVSVSLFNAESNGCGGVNHSALSYCRNINALMLKDGAWASARIVGEHVPCAIENLLPNRRTFSDLILCLDDKAIQKFFKEADSQDIAIAIKRMGANIQDKLFRNMSKQAAMMIKEDMEYSGDSTFVDVTEKQEILSAIILRLEAEGEIVFIDPPPAPPLAKDGKSASVTLKD